MTDIFENFNADGNSKEFVSRSADIVIGDESSTFSGTVKVQAKQNAKMDWTTLASYTEQGAYKITNNHGMRFRLNLSGSTSPNINYSVKY